MSEEETDLQARVDAAALALLHGSGVLAVAVTAHPDTPYAQSLRGYTVVLDPRCEPGKVYLR